MGKDLVDVFGNSLASQPVKRRSTRKPKIAKTWESTDFDLDPLELLDFNTYIWIQNITA